MNFIEKRVLSSSVLFQSGEVYWHVEGTKVAAVADIAVIEGWLSFAKNIAAFEASFGYGGRWCGQEIWRKQHQEL